MAGPQARAALASSLALCTLSNFIKSVLLIRSDVHNMLLISMPYSIHFHNVCGSRRSTLAHAPTHDMQIAMLGKPVACVHTYRYNTPTLRSFLAFLLVGDNLEAGRRFFLRRTFLGNLTPTS